MIRIKKVLESQQEALQARQVLESQQEALHHRLGNLKPTQTTIGART